MQKKYAYDAVGMEFDKHPVLSVAGQIEDAFEAIGRPVDLVGMLEPEPNTEPARQGLYLTPDLSDGLEDSLDNIGWLSMNEDIAGHFGDPTGSTEVTHVVVENDLSVAQVVEALDKAEYSDDDGTDMITKVMHLVELIGIETDPEPRKVVAYDLLRKALGWEAEKALNRTPDFKKATASQDTWGVDLIAQSDAWTAREFPTQVRGFQLKTMQRVASKGAGKLADKEHPHLAYAWMKDGLLVADLEEISGSDDMVKTVKAETGTTGTVLKKSIKSGPTKNYHRPARVAAWE